MSTPHLYPECRLQQRLLSYMQKHFSTSLIEPANEGELQNAFAVFYRVEAGIRVQKLRISAAAELGIHDTKLLPLGTIECLPLAVPL